MKKILFLMLAGLMSLTASADIPSGKTIYLDCTQHWCCAGSYFVYLSRDNTSHLMTPVQGQPGVYSYTTTSSTQDNLRFCSTSATYTSDQSGQKSPHTEDVKGWSAAKPYYVIDSEDGKTGHWSATPNQLGESGIVKAAAEAGPTNCVDSLYEVVIRVELSGKPCMLELSGADLKDPVKRSAPEAEFVYYLSNMHDADTDAEHTFVVRIYADAAGTELIEERTLTYTAPEYACVREHRVSLCLGDEAQVSSSFEGQLYDWSTGDSTKTITVYGDRVGVDTVEVNTFNTVLTLEQNLMANGGFEEGTNGFSSDYHAVSYTGIDYYESPSGIKSNIFVITANTNRFWRDYAVITPHSGNYLALFDAGTSGYAWKTTTAMNPALILTAGHDYIFSYWAAYPNGERNQSPAVLQFVIEYTDDQGVPHTENLGTPYQMGQETNMNAWVQKFHIFHSDYNSQNVMIGVYDSNTASLGNDFCLDDIVFQEVSEQVLQRVFTDRFIITTRKNCVCEGEPLYRKWDDVLFVDNKDSLYVSYQWYLDSVAIEGATRQYYRMPKGETGMYHVEMVTTAGDTVHTCPQDFFSAEESAAIYPGKTSKRIVEKRWIVISPNFRVEQVLYDDNTTECFKHLVR